MRMTMHRRLSTFLHVYFHNHDVLIVRKYLATNTFAKLDKIHVLIEYYIGCHHTSLSFARQSIICDMLVA